MESMPMLCLRRRSHWHVVLRQDWTHQDGCQSWPSTTYIQRLLEEDAA